MRCLPLVNHTLEGSGFKQRGADVNPGHGRADAATEPVFDSGSLVRVSVLRDNRVFKQLVGDGADELLWDALIQRGLTQRAKPSTSAIYQLNISTRVAKEMPGVASVELLICLCADCACGWHFQLTN